MQERPQEPVQPLRPPGNGPPGNGPPNPDQDILDQLTLDSFTATPSTITVGTNESVTLDWHVTEPAIARARNISFTLESSAGSFPVGPVGSQSAQISGPTTFSLVARLGRASLDLGDVSITAVPNPACLTITLTSNQLADIGPSAVGGDVGPKAGNQARLKGSADPNDWLIHTDGIHAVLHFAVPTDVGIDIDVDVSITLIPVLSGGQLSLTYSNFNVEANFPWWVNIFAPGVTTIVEEVIDHIITGQIKPQLPGVLQKAISDVMFLQGKNVPQFQLGEGQLVLTVCPQ